MLGGVGWQFVTEVSGQPIGPIFKALQEDFLNHNYNAEEA
jgi:hypothetical protein